jgi:hypothetical protein
MGGRRARVRKHAGAFFVHGGICGFVSFEPNFIVS